MSSDTLPPILIGYARVSTSDQTVNPQLDELVRAGVDPDRIYTDVASGAKAERLGLAACLRALQPGNVLVVVKLDRLARSVAHLVELGQVLERRRVALRVLNLGIDTETPVGRLMFTIVAGIAEFELDLIRERTRAGLAAARARGRQGSRPWPARWAQADSDRSAAGHCTDALGGPFHLGGGYRRPVQGVSPYTVPGTRPPAHAIGRRGVKGGDGSGAAADPLCAKEPPSKQGGSRRHPLIIVLEEERPSGATAMRVMEIRDHWSVDHIAEVQRPEPIPGPTQILLRMKAATLNYRDHVLVRRGYGNRSGELPLVPVSDGVGEVVAVGAAVTRFKIGERACPTFFQNWASGPFKDGWWRSQLGGPRDGVMQEFMVVEEHAAVRVPEFLTDLQAATLPCAAVTAWNAVVTQNPVKAGDVVVVQGTGGVSLFALQFAKMQGARVIALSSSDAKLERVKALGADHLVNYRAVPEWGRTVRALTDGLGADHIVEVGGAGTLAQSVRAVRGGGTVSLIGVLGGAAAEVSLGHVVTQNLRLQGVAVGSRDLFEDMLRAIDQHRLRPVLDERVYAFTEVAEAIRRLPDGRHFGKVGVVFA